MINSIIKTLGSDVREIIEDIVSEDTLKAYEVIGTRSVRSLRRIL